MKSRLNNLVLSFSVRPTDLISSSVEFDIHEANPWLRCNLCIFCTIIPSLFVTFISTSSLQKTLIHKDIILLFNYRVFHFRRKIFTLLTFCEIQFIQLKRTGRLSLSHSYLKSHALSANTIQQILNSTTSNWPSSSSPSMGLLEGMHSKLTFSSLKVPKKTIDTKSFNEVYHFQWERITMYAKNQLRCTNLSFMILFIFINCSLLLYTSASKLLLTEYEYCLLTHFIFT
jgi:hypothetical protein